MLNAVYKATHRDLLDSLLPFVKVAIGRSGQVGAEVKANEVAVVLNQDLGFSSIPFSVTKILLNRLSPVTLEKRKGQYFLRQDLSAEIEKFDQVEKKQDNHCQEVGEALSNRIKSMRGGAKLSSSEALDYLLLFFEAHGLSVAENPKYLNSLTSNKKASFEYQVGQFILEEHENNSVLFEYISEILKGFFLSLAISLHSQTGGNGQAKLKGTVCYLDTSLILDLLDCNTPEDKQSSAQMLEMLKEQGAEIHAFSHSVSEVDGILNAYELSLKNPKNNYSYHTLEGFDARDFTWEDVVLFHGRMHETLTGLGIKIVNKPSFNNGAAPCINEKGLEEYLDSKMKYPRSVALQRDVDSISAIAFLRGDSNPCCIEKCGHIFITSNSSLARLATDYCGQNQDDRVVPFIIEETHFTSLLWLKCYSTHNDYPRIKLIKDALASTAASEDILEAFYREVRSLEVGGGITEAEALAMRSHLFNRRELMKLVEGDVEQVGSSMVLSIRDNLQKQYGAEAAAAISKKNNELLAAIAHQSDDKVRALEQIWQTGQEASERWAARLLIIAKAGLAVLFLICLFVVVIDAAFSGHSLLFGFVLGLLSILGLFDVFSSRKTMIKASILRISQLIADKKMDDLRKNFESVFGELDSEPTEKGSK